MSKPRATTDSARVQSKVSSGSDRQPSGPSWISADSVERRVDQVADLAVDVPGEDPQPDADLRRRQAGAGRVEHGVGEVLRPAGAAPCRSRRPRSRACAAPGRRTGGWAGWPRGSSSRERSGTVVRSAEVDRVDLDPYRRRACGRAHPLQLAERRGTAPAPAGAGHPDHRPRLSASGRRPATGPSTSAPGGQLEQGERVVDGARLAGDRGQPATPAAGGPPAARRSRARRTRPGPSAPAPAAPGAAGSPTASDPAAGPDQPGGVAPAAQRLLAGAQVGPGQQQPGVEQHHGGVPARRPPARRPAWRPRSPGWPSTVGRAPGRRRSVRTGTPREGPAELLGGARVAEHRRAQPAVAALGAGPRVGGGAAPAAGRRRRRPGQRQRPGQAAHRAGVRQRSQARRGGVARPRGLHQHRARRSSAVADGVVGLAAGSGRAGVRVAVEARGRWPRRPRTVTRSRSSVARRGDLVRPAGAEQVLAPRRCARSRRPAPRRPPARRAAAAPRGCAGRAPAARRAGRRRRPRSTTRPRSWTGAKAAAAGADHDPPGAAGDGEEVAVARAPGPRSAVSTTWWPAPEHVGQRGVDPGDVLAVGHAEQRAAAAGARSRRRRGRAASASRSPGAARPHRPRRAAVGEVAQERRRRGSWSAQAALAAAGVAGRPVGAGGGRLASRSWRAGAGRPAGARRSGSRRTARRRRAAQRGDRGASTGSALTTRRSGVSRPGWSLLVDPLDDVAVDVLAGEPHLDPRRPGRASCGHRRGHEVVERPVEVGQRHVDQHPRDRVAPRRARPRRPCGRASACGLRLRARPPTRASPGSSSGCSPAPVMADVYQRPPTSTPPSASERAPSRASSTRSRRRARLRRRRRP